jgi:hypothetical protein
MEPENMRLPRDQRALVRIALDAAPEFRAAIEGMLLNCVCSYGMDESPCEICGPLRRLMEEIALP